MGSRRRREHEPNVTASASRRGRQPSCHRQRPARPAGLPCWTRASSACRSAVSWRSVGFRGFAGAVDEFADRTAITAAISPLADLPGVPSASCESVRPPCSLARSAVGREAQVLPRDRNRGLVRRRACQPRLDPLADALDAALGFGLRQPFGGHLGFDPPHPRAHDRFQQAERRVPRGGGGDRRQRAARAQLFAQLRLADHRRRPTRLRSLPRGSPAMLPPAAAPPLTPPGAPASGPGAAAAAPPPASSARPPARGPSCGQSPRSRPARSRSPQPPPRLPPSRSLSACHPSPGSLPEHTTAPLPDPRRFGFGPADGGDRGRMARHGGPIARRPAARADRHGSPRARELPAGHRRRSHQDARGGPRPRLGHRPPRSRRAEQRGRDRRRRPPYARC